jgi:hypothetical protein
MNELRVVCSNSTPAYVQEGGVCDNEVTSCALKHPTMGGPAIFALVLRQHVVCSVRMDVEQPLPR